MDPQNNKTPEGLSPGPQLEVKRKIRVMFVDDDPMVVRGIARNMSMMGVKMDIAVRTSAAEALASLEKELVDVIITDLYMPGIDGAALLEEVRSRYPTVLRFVLSGEAKPGVMVQAARLSHQYLSKPCETALLHKTIVETVARMGAIKNPEVSKTITHLEGVPSRQASLAEFLRLLSDNSVSLDAIATSLKKDPGLSARLLKVANSPYFGHSGAIESLDDAIGLLGMDMIVSMAATHKLFAVTPPPAASNLQLDALWTHCVYVSSLVRHLGYKLKVSQAVMREAGTAALLHDIGKLVLAHAAPSAFAAAYTRAQAEHMPGWQAEYFIFGNHHAEIGGCLLKLWGLPVSVVEAVSMHHTPHNATEDRVGPVTLLHIADTLAHAGSDDGAATFLDVAHLKSLNLSGDMNYWLGLRPE
jgi:HD-like signal output (HDOD) protein